MINPQADDLALMKRNWQQFYGTFVFNETPTGTINGVNTVFTLVTKAHEGTLQLFKSGLLLKPATNYTVVGKTITFVVAPAGGSVLLAHYMK